MPVNDTKEVLAVFDFDGTITSGDTLLPWLWHLSSPVEFFAGMTRCMPWLLAYGLGIVSNEKAKNQLLDTFLRGKSTRTVDQASQFFLNEVLPGLLRPAALDRIADHRAAGHTLVLISASPDLYVKPWGVSHSFHHVICSSIRRDSRRITGGLEGRNCYGEVKAARLRSLIPDLDACHIIAYGDSEGDRQLLDLADESHYKPFQ